MPEQPAWRPRVSVGVPVYNGANGLAAALECLCNQTFRDIEIVVSDNGSTDATPEICRRFTESDARIRYIRQPAPIPVTDNFKCVLRAARAPYFMWAAHDDLRGPDFIQRLAAALDRNPNAILAFGDIVELLDGEARPLRLDFANVGQSAAVRLRQAALFQLHHLYGVWRTDKLRSIPWRHNDWWHDTPLMMAATMLGDFVYVPGVIFRYRYNRHPFFDWQRRPGLAGPMDDVAALYRRCPSLARLVWFSGTAVAQIAGPARGLLAGYYGGQKVLRQIGGYVLRHHLGRLLPPFIGGIPAKAGTHSPVSSNLSSDHSPVQNKTRSCFGDIGPGFRRGDK
jgi:glycosyltransferase involved in cell wall biosynthesis